MRAIRLGSGEFDLRYKLYKQGDFVCCPTGGTADVRFRLAGSTLLQLDPLPEPGFRTTPLNYPSPGSSGS